MWYAAVAPPPDGENKNGELRVTLTGGQFCGWRQGVRSVASIRSVLPGAGVGHRPPCGRRRRD
jgi:hypothetical protein